MSSLNLRKVVMLTHSIMSILCKILEREFNSRFVGYLEAKDLFSDRQAGFPCGRITGDLAYATHFTKTRQKQSTAWHDA